MRDIYQISCWDKVKSYFIRFMARKAYWRISKVLIPIYDRYTPIKHTFAKHGWQYNTTEDFFVWLKENKPETLEELYKLEDQVWRKKGIIMFDKYARFVKPLFNEYKTTNIQQYETV